MRAEFTDDLITGNELIDSQHEELVESTNSSTVVKQAKEK